MTIQFLFTPQVFVHSKVFFSIGGRHFSGEPVLFSYMPDTIMDHARDVTIKLHHRVGKYLKINLYFAVKWIMLSEISFISGMLQQIKNVHWHLIYFY